jgi:transcriptional/translational regulatory protein YebC/TACO1
MSGHNKWSKIKNKKAVTDAQKSKIFGKLVRFITIESKKSGGDINSPGLRSTFRMGHALRIAWSSDKSIQVARVATRTYRPAMMRTVNRVGHWTA